MKVSINLSASPEPRDRYTLAWAIPLTLMAAVVLVYFSLAALRDLRKYRQYHGSLLEDQKQETQLIEKERRLTEDLDRPQSREAFRVAKFVNTLIGKKRFALMEFMGRVTKLLPPAVRLDGLAFSKTANGSVVRFNVAGKSEEAVEAFLTNLEDSTDFKNVIILNMGLPEKEASGNLFTVTCTAVYAGETLD